ncbi:MAG: nickel-responsive transcriptional regulator NikR [Desulfovibrionaceae bacterium]|nr:nickel-responsive transcriptional regulator NikR [Desulfovibrionaceae bacterium]
MSGLTRFGVSLDEDMLKHFDQLCEQKHYSNRSEAIRDLIRQYLIEAKWEDNTDCRAGTLTLVYDHHKNDLAKRLTDIQHEDFDIIVTTMHVHLDHDNCLEVLVMKGDPKRVQSLADKLISCTGVKHGVFCKTSIGNDLL